MSTREREENAHRRYGYIRLVAHCRKLTMRDLHRSYCAEVRPVSQAFFYRVASGERTSAPVRRFISKKLALPHKELWT